MVVFTYLWSEQKTTESYQPANKGGSDINTHHTQAVLLFQSSDIVSRSQSQCPHTLIVKYLLNFCICTVWIWHHLHLIRSCFITESVTNCLWLWMSIANVLISFQPQLMKFMTKSRQELWKFFLLFTSETVICPSVFQMTININI